jgi:hypothetical protein
MVQQRTFRIVAVGSGHGAGPAVTAAADKQVLYTGAQVGLTSAREQLLKRTAKITGLREKTR